MSVFECDFVGGSMVEFEVGVEVVFMLGIDMFECVFVLFCSLVFGDGCLDFLGCVCCLEF